jgi:hypothetical protein
MIDDLVRGVRTQLLVLLCAVGCMLLIACLNVSNLLVARSAARRKEVAIRGSLGGSRLALIREQMTESMLICAAGGGLGLLLRHRPCPLGSAAMTRWQVAAAPSRPDRFGGLGGTSFDLSLQRNRRGRCGRWITGWNHDERIFVPQALSLGVAATAHDRPDRAYPLRRSA